MANIDRKKLSRIIQEELKKALEEEALVTDYGAEDNYRKKFHASDDDCGCNNCADCGQKKVSGQHKKHYKGAYMSKTQLYKIAKYAEKLYQIIPDGHNLEDWMRAKLSQMSDDISEVYHALDHDKFEGEI